MELQAKVLHSLVDAPREASGMSSLAAGTGNVGAGRNRSGTFLLGSSKRKKREAAGLPPL